MEASLAPQPAGDTSASTRDSSMSASVNASSSSPAAARSPATRTSQLPQAASPSSVPTRGRRRESIGAQMRRNVSSSTAMAAGAGGGIGSTLLRPQQNGTTQNQHGSIAGRANSSSTAEPNLPFSTSFGAAGAALSSSAVTARSLSALAGSGASSLSTIKGEKSLGHTHFGQECYGPQADDKLTTTPPAKAMLSSSASAAGSIDARRGSFSSTVDDDAQSVTSASDGKGGQHLHKCESCSKVYRHPSCLVKHRWEHTVYWKQASKFLMSKHQQVQLLEAAAILVGMDADARSLPEEKALWPAAVSPPESGLLGSDKLNLTTLLAAKARRKSQTPSNGGDSNATPLVSASVPTRGLSGSRAGSALSPLNVPTSLHHLGGARGAGVGAGGGISSSSGGYRHRRADSDVRHDKMQLDESAERLDRSGSADTDDHEGELDDDDDEDVADSPPTSHEQDEAQDKEERWGLDAGGDVMAEMEMDE